MRAHLIDLPVDCLAMVNNLQTCSTRVSTRTRTRVHFCVLMAVLVLMAKYSYSWKSTHISKAFFLHRLLLLIFHTFLTEKRACLAVKLLKMFHSPWGNKKYFLPFIDLKSNSWTFSTMTRELEYSKRLFTS